MPFRGFATAGRLRTRNRGHWRGGTEYRNVHRLPQQLLRFLPRRVHPGAWRENAAIYYQNADAADALDTRLPVVDAEKCNGCGACEAVCVSAQAGSTMNASERAIVVKPLEG
ncbi:MAG: 4Fe-4S binding protein [Adlercreutzia equolifaciens]